MHVTLCQKKNACIKSRGLNAAHARPSLATGGLGMGVCLFICCSCLPASQDVLALIRNNLTKETMFLVEWCIVECRGVLASHMVIRTRSIGVVKKWKINYCSSIALLFCTKCGQELGAQTDGGRSIASGSHHCRVGWLRLCFFLFVGLHTTLLLYIRGNEN